ncbi:hypothetical protein SISNIDRAFT_459556, partial [Sistotremastrum niveocremeum HHB9708]
MSRIQNLRRSEIYLHILNGLYIHDIVSLALSMRACYAVTRFFPSVWTNAADPSNIPLPTGYTLSSSLPPPLIFRHALRSRQISSNLNKNHPTPISSRVVFDCTASDGLTYPSKPIYGGQWMVVHNESNVWIHSTRATCSSTGDMDEVFSAEGKIVGCEVEILGDGLVVVVILERTVQNDQRFWIIKLKFSLDSDTYDVVHPPIALHIRNLGKIEGDVYSVRKSIIAFLANDSIYVLNWVTQSGARLDVDFELMEFKTLQRTFFSSNLQDNYLVLKILGHISFRIIEFSSSKLDDASPAQTQTRNIDASRWSILPAHTVAGLNIPQKIPALNLSLASSRGLKHIFDFTQYDIIRGQRKMTTTLNPILFDPSTHKLEIGSLIPLKDYLSWNPFSQFLNSKDRPTWDGLSEPFGSSVPVVFL